MRYSRFFNVKPISLLLLGCLLVSQVEAARLPPPSPIYINLEPIEPPDLPPQVDAVIFDNRSLFVDQNAAFLLQNVTFFLLTGFGGQLYEAQSVRFWTNSGTMVGVPGFRFETLPDVRRLPPRLRRRPGANLPKPAAAFVNHGDILVSGMLFIHSTNVISPGRLEGDLGSRITVHATNGVADLSRGAIRVGRVTSQFAPPPGFFFNLDPELVTLYAATGTNGFYNRSNLPPLFLPTAFTPVIFGTNFTNFASAQPRPPFYEALVNPTVSGQPVTTRITNFLSSVPTCGGDYAAFAQVTDFGFFGGRNVTVAFVETNSFIETNVSIDVRFLGGFFGSSIAVQYSSPEFDIIEQQVRTNVVTLVDSGFISPMPPPTNVFSFFPSPFNYQFVRGRVPGFELGSPGNTNFTPALFYDQNFQTDSVAYAYSTISWQIGPTNLSLFNAPVITPFFTGFALGVHPAAADPTNFPSRVEITSKELSLDHTRIRAEQAIDIRTTNLRSNNFATVDAPFVNFDVGTTNVNLLISNLAPVTVNRAHGQLSAYSAVWTVNVTNVFTNIFFTNIVVAPVNFHVLIVGNCLQFTQPTILHRLALQATNLLLEDNLFVNNSAKINSEAVTIGRNASLQLPLRTSWAFTNIQNVSHLTNLGIINVPGAGAFFGTAPSGYVFPRQTRRQQRRNPNRIEAYTDFVNHGIIVAATESINSSLVENTGSLFNPALLVATNGPILITANSVIVSNAVLAAGQNIEIRANDVSLRNSLISAGSTNIVGESAVIVPGSLIIDATNSLGDTGVAFTNQINVTGGIRIPTRPETARDLLGSSVRVHGGIFSDSQIVWAGEDRGPVVEGFSGNLALGQLTLDGGTGGGAIGNFFSFRGATSGDAIYVDYLELLNHATNFSFALGVAPDFTIYFADSNILPEKIDETSGGRVRWVSQFTGPRSSTNIVYPNGVTYVFNAGVVRSRDRDDDGDGVVNAEDCTPISVPDFDSTLPCPPAPAAAKTVALSTQNIYLTIALASGGREVVLNWDATANSANTVEFTDSLAGPAGAGWQSLTNFINGPVNARVTVKDAVGGPLRVYRVRVDAGKP